MTDVGAQNTPAHSHRRPAGWALVPPLLFLAAAVMGADFTAISLRPLEALQIHYAHAMAYAHVIAPAGCAVLWLVAFRKWPRIGSVVAVLLCFWLVGSIPHYAESRVASIPVNRWLESTEMQAMQAGSGFPTFEQGSRDGDFVLVAPQHEQQARNELARLGLLRLHTPAAG